MNPNSILQPTSRELYIFSECKELFHNVSTAKGITRDEIALCAIEYFILFYGTMLMYIEYTMEFCVKQR